MPLQNRVTPFGTLITDPARGTLMGNRGCLHDDTRHPRRLYQTRRWIFCQLAFKGRRRTLMAPWRYTELFFLDEATALAAGHRPCVECNRALFREFVGHWTAANDPGADGGPLAADALDAQLHRERLTDAPRQRDRRQRVSLVPLDGLPDACFVALGPEPAAHLVLGAHLHPWSPSGYGPPLPRPAGLAVTLLTPPSVVRALAHGYAPAIHPTASPQ